MQQQDWDPRHRNAPAADMSSALKLRSSWSSQANCRSPPRRASLLSSIPNIKNVRSLVSVAILDSWTPMRPMQALDTLLRGALFPGQRKRLGEVRGARDFGMQAEGQF